MDLKNDEKKDEITNELKKIRQDLENDLKDEKLPSPDAPNSVGDSVPNRRAPKFFSKAIGSVPSKIRKNIIFSFYKDLPRDLKKELLASIKPSEEELQTNEEVLNYILQKLNWNALSDDSYFVIIFAIGQINAFLADYEAISYLMEEKNVPKKNAENSDASKTELRKEPIAQNKDS